MTISSISAILKNKGIGLKSCFEQLFIHSLTDSWINCTTESQSDCKDYHWFPNECSIIEYLIYTSIWCDCCLRDMSFCLEVLKLVVSSVFYLQKRSGLTGKVIYLMEKKKKFLACLFSMIRYWLWFTNFVCFFWRNSLGVNKHDIHKIDCWISELSEVSQSRSNILIKLFLHDMLFTLCYICRIGRMKR